MRSEPALLQQIRVASPCSASWDQMDGDDRTRFCGHCQKHVYNLSSFTTAEIEELVRATGDQFCRRLYRRRDGTLLTADCPVGRRRLRRDLIASVGFLGLLMGVLGAAAAAAAPALARVREWPVWDQEPLYPVALRLGLREEMRQVAPPPAPPPFVVLGAGPPPK